MNPFNSSIEANNNFIVQKDKPTMFACNYQEFIIQFTRTSVYFYDERLKFIKEYKLGKEASLFNFKKKGDFFIYTTDNLLLQYNINLLRKIIVFIFRYRVFT